MNQPTPFELAPDGILVDAIGRALVLPCAWPTDGRSQTAAKANAREISGLFARAVELAAFREEVEAAVAERRCDDFSDLLKSYDSQEKEADKLRDEIARLEGRMDELTKEEKAAS